MRLLASTLRWASTRRKASGSPSLATGLAVPSTLCGAFAAVLMLWVQCACCGSDLRGHGRYAHYDYSPSFSDFTRFGGWSHPSIKQYTGTSDVCGASIDNDWYP